MPGINTLYKIRDGDLLIVTGDLSKREIRELTSDGYRPNDPHVNKHGIPIKPTRRGPFRRGR